MLAGVTDPARVKRGICAAGHKALYADDWGGLPDKEFLAALDPRLADLRDRLYDKAYDATEPAGSLCAEWAGTLGLPAGIPIAIGEFDVHYGAIGCGVREGTLVKVIGTSTCDCAVVSADKTVAGHSRHLRHRQGRDPARLLRHRGRTVGRRRHLQMVGRGRLRRRRRAARGTDAPRPPSRSPDSPGLLALDWNNGNRTILVDQLLSGLILGQDLYTTRADIYRALIEATAFGARAIIERIEEYGVPIDRIVCAGGIAEKNPLLMQIYADVTGCTMQVAEFEPDLRSGLGDFGRRARRRPSRLRRPRRAR